MLELVRHVAAGTWWTACVYVKMGWQVTRCGGNTELIGQESAPVKWAAESERGNGERTVAGSCEGM